MSRIVAATMRLAFAFFALITATEAMSAPCAPLLWRDKSYVVCEADPKRDTIRTAFRDPAGEVYGGLGAFSSAQQASGVTLLFAMNGGMYHPDMRPVGLYIEAGRLISRLSTSCGRQNFNMCPNGVFFVAGGKAGVMETRRFARAGLRPDFATQSGPMLVINGNLHPKFRADSDSRKIRNGVGVRADGMVLFAISDDYVSFHEFAELFRDELQTPNALFLDGTISSLHAESVNRS